MGAHSGSPPRVTVDTNQFVSALIRRGASFRLLEAWSRGELIVVSSQALATEVAAVLRRPFLRQKYDVPESVIQGLLDRLEQSAEVVAELRPLPEDLPLRDPKDARILQTALGGGAHYLVTGDDDLLSLAGHASLGLLQIVTVGEFLRRLAGA
jgi:uncharacterized protein